jgi:predicted ATPase
MLFTKFELNNLYSFNNLVVDMTLPKKRNANTVDHEYLKNSPAFHVKRLCIISGANATGKTSLGKTLCGLQNVLRGRIAQNMLKIHDKNSPATARLEFVTPESDTLHEVWLEFAQKDTEVLLSSYKHRHIPIAKRDSAGTARAKLATQEYKASDTPVASPLDLAQEIKNANSSVVQSWRYAISLTDTEDFPNLSNHSFNVGATEKILMSFDPTIKEIKTLSADDEPDTPSAYKIIFANNDTVQVDLTNKDITNKDRLSKGTHEAIEVADFILSLAKRRPHSTTFFLDEKMAHVHSDLEVSILNKMIGILGEESQLFYTTHNTDVLDMNLLPHSYLFLMRSETGCVSAVQPEHRFTKNDRTLRSYVENDVFKTRPNADLIDNLELHDEKDQ